MAMRLAVTVGDPAGIGPEVVLKALARTDRPPAEMIVYGPASVLRERAARFGLRPLESLAARIVDVPPTGPIPLGVTSPAGGPAAPASGLTPPPPPHGGVGEAHGTPPPHKE